MNEEKKLDQENQNPEETFQERGDPGRTDRGPSKPTPEITENPGQDRGPSKPTPEITENPAKVDRGPTSNEKKIEPDSPGKGDRGPS
ncbi:hypothetical protein [Lyngbya sp. PCC 8106]|uniref:hypothetical protein n=1 Tax=Lyngbya sp. (strain PCC 8106) TaxID=313612 RepID=UPI0003115E7C|nr:hypothetical protein [Lyngbya sp. PCC 8106]